VLAVGVLVLLGGRRAEAGLAAAIAFHVALLSFGWGFSLWALPMIAALTRLLVGQHVAGAPLVVMRPAPSARRA
jgi:hypothetical protein